MEDLIILVLFILASLASYISKQRELKRRKKEGLDGEEQTEEFPWPDTSFEPEFKPVIEEIPFPRESGKKPAELEVIPEEEKSAFPGSFLKPESPISSETEPSAPLVIQRLTPDSFREVEALPERVLGFGLPMGKTGKKLAHYDLPSMSARKRRSHTRINLKSKTSLRNAFLVREILDRARAFDI